MFVYHVWSVHLVRTVYRCQSKEHGEIRKWPSSSNSNSSIHVEIKLSKKKREREGWANTVALRHSDNNAKSITVFIFTWALCMFSVSFSFPFCDACNHTQPNNELINIRHIFTFYSLDFSSFTIYSHLNRRIYRTSLPIYTLNACVCVVYLVRLSQGAALVTIRHACVYPSSPFCQSLWYAFRHISALSHTITICWSLFSRFFSLFRCPRFVVVVVVVLAVAFLFVLLLSFWRCSYEIRICVGHFESAILKLFAVQSIRNGKTWKKTISFYTRTHTHTYTDIHVKWIPIHANTTDHSCAYVFGIAKKCKNVVKINSVNTNEKWKRMRESTRKRKKRRHLCSDVVVVLRIHCI